MWGEQYAYVREFEFYYWMNGWKEKGEMERREEGCGQMERESESQTEKERGQ